ncbi:hypothetical protein HAX54_008795, partial [Datura stramonium]|nr:hypothetical protein [Datura stramonium]
VVFSSPRAISGMFRRKLWNIYEPHVGTEHRSNFVSAILGPCLHAPIWHCVTPLGAWFCLHIVKVLAQMCLRDAIFYYAVELAPFDFVL